MMKWIASMVCSVGLKNETEANFTINAVIKQFNIRWTVNFKIITKIIILVVLIY